MAFDGNPQFSCLSFYNARQITFCIGNLRQQFVGEAQQPFSDRGKAQRRGFSFEQRCAVVVFKHTDLVGKCGLGKENPFGGKGDAAGFFKCQQGFEVAQFDDGIHKASDGILNRRILK
ncbi:hypothetical protein NEILACOT_04124 [Neisseria lactamica ATCC 23970]|uniref:Uncharacterized protein n=1 Tax=Neisseria lactamica ATCC 23970 TaxID=546265 RepID=D0W9B5_NEILA|nr:hypothetical protein NEILACOT_04124 [Neisseria lactamica ATCC 23970]